MGQLEKDIVETAENFAENFKDKGSFDFSTSSLEEVDLLLEEMSDFIFDDEEAIYNTYTMVGCYVFEAARRSYGGEYYWIAEEQQPVLVIGEPDFCVSIKAWEKVKGRIINGEEDNIPFYMAGLKECVEKGRATKGYSAEVI